MQTSSNKNINKWKTLIAAFILLCAAFVTAVVLNTVFNISVLLSSIVSIVWVAIAGFFLLSSLIKKNEILSDNLEADREDKKYRDLLFDSIVKSVADGLLYFNEEKIMMINDAAKEILKINDDDIDTYSYDELMEPFSKELVYDKLISQINGERAEEIVTSGGLTYSVKFSIPRLAGESIENRGIDGIILTMSDITESYQLENKQVDFVANVSHELKTPLTTVKAYAETLLEGEIDDAEMTKEFLDIIVSEADRMDRLVKDLLLLDRIDHNQGKWNKDECDVVSLVKTAVRKMDMTAKAKEIVVNNLFDDDLSISAELDRDRMEQVLLNILSNSIKYTSEKGRIDVDIFQEEKCIQIVISDNGIGIPEKAQARVFERFFMVNRARTRDSGGTGLGLAISKQIVEEHNGTIGIESKFGKGTKVTISLPIMIIRGQSGIL